MNYAETITAGLRKEIENSSKSKAQIAAELGVSRPTISQYLSGRIQPSLETFAKLCRVLNCSADDILGLKKRGKASSVAKSQSVQ